MMYDALIIVNGEIAQRTLWEEITFQTIACSDGAALELKKRNLVPHLILGDMDSVEDHDPIACMTLLQQLFPQAHILLIYDQETTDLEKALQHAHGQQYQRVLCLGALGKAADHSLYNLSLLTRFSQKLDLVFLHPVENLAQWIFPLKPHMRLRATKNSIISFWPMTEALITTRGLQWELQKKNLFQLKNSSVRNRTLSEVIEIECQGPCLCFLTTPHDPFIIN